MLETDQFEGMRELLYHQIRYFHTTDTLANDGLPPLRNDACDACLIIREDIVGGEVSSTRHGTQ